MSTQNTLLVTGASGHLGRLVLDDLLNRGINPKQIIATTRSVKNLDAYAKRGVDVREADFNKPESLAKAFQGATRVLLISTDAVGSRLDQHKNAITAAKKAGAQHILYTSVPNPDRSLAAVSPEHKETEIAIEASGLTYTFLRNSLYADLLLGTYEQALKSGKIFGARGAARTSYVTREDCARAAAGALASTERVNAIYDITGPEALSLSDLAAVFSKVASRPIEAVDLPLSDFNAGLRSAGLPDGLVELLGSFESAIAQGTLTTVTKAVKTLSGEEPTSIARFLNR